MFAIAEGNGWNCWLFSPTLRAFNTTQFVCASEAAGVAVDRYVLESLDPANPTLIQRCKQAGRPDKWKVQRMDECLNESGDWEPEPLPSNRDGAFLERCRYDTDQVAIEAAISASQKEKRLSWPSMSRPTAASNAQAPEVVAKVATMEKNAC
jgi:hypothetical protein